MSKPGKNSNKTDNYKKKKIEQVQIKKQNLNQNKNQVN